MILTASRKIRGGNSLRGGSWRRLSPPFAGQAGFVAEDLDADPDRHPHAATNLSLNGSARWSSSGKTSQDITKWAVRIGLWRTTASPGLYKLDPRAEPGGCEWLLATLAVIAIDHRIVIESRVFCLNNADGFLALVFVLQSQPVVLAYDQRIQRTLAVCK